MAPSAMIADLRDYLERMPGAIFLLAEPTELLVAWELRRVDPSIREDVETLYSYYLTWRSSPCSILDGRTPESYASSWSDADDLMDFLDQYIRDGRFEAPTVLIQRLGELLGSGESLRRLPSWIPEPGWDEVEEARGRVALAAFCAGSFPVSIPRLVSFLDTPESLEPLEELAISALAAAGFPDHNSLIEALAEAKTQGSRYSIAAALSRLGPDQRISEALIELFREQQDPEDQDVFGYLLADYGDPSALSDLTEAIRRPELPPEVFHGLKSSIESLGGSVPSDIPVPPIPDEDDDYDGLGPWDKASDLVYEGRACLDLGEYDEAEGYFSKALDLAPEHWEAGLRLAEIWQRRGEEDRDRDLAGRMLESIEAEWSADPPDCDAGELERLRQLADRVLGKPDERRLARLLTFCQGALYFYGVTTVGELVAMVRDGLPEPANFSWTNEELWAIMENDSRFVVHEGGLVSHPSVLNPAEVLRERGRRGRLGPRPYSLDDYLLATEGRAQLCWGRDEEKAIEGLRAEVGTMPGSPEPFIRPSDPDAQFSLPSGSTSRVASRHAQSISGAFEPHRRVL